MPWIARRGNETVIPEGVADGVEVECPGCGGVMFARGPSSDGRARHFFHPSGGGVANCSGGESDVHRKLKSLAVSWLKQRFDEEERKRCGPEIAVDLREDQSSLTDFGEGVDSRVADALVEFRTPDQNYYNGLIIEVQYRNKGKDIRATTDDYLDLGYSVFWATEADFTDDRFVSSIARSTVTPWTKTHYEYEKTVKEYFDHPGYETFEDWAREFPYPPEINR